MPRLLSTLLLVTALSAASYATTIHVPGDQPTIQAGLDSAVEGDTVLVAPGTYYENIIWPAVNGIKLIGSGEENCIIDGGSQSNVILFNENLGVTIDTTTIISGFTCQNGTAQGETEYRYGGGICCYECDPKFKNVIITGNYATLSGGGLFCDESNLILADVTICDNSALVHAGGLLCYSSDIRLTNVTIDGNSAESEGGAYFRSSNPSLYNVRICDNSSLFVGGVAIQWDSNATLTNVTIAGNYSPEVGGICLGSSFVSLQNCIIWNYASVEVLFWYTGEPCSLAIACSNIEGGEASIETDELSTVLWLENNIDADPLFCDPNNDDYRLQLDSPCRTDVCGFMGYTGETCEGEGVEELAAHPSGFYLADAYPNPFNPVTTIKFTLPHPQDIQVAVYNLLGQQAATLADGPHSAGIHQITFDGSGLASGVYVYRLVADNQVITKKMALVK